MSRWNKSNVSSASALEVLMDRLRVTTLDVPLVASPQAALFHAARDLGDDIGAFDNLAHVHFKHLSHHAIDQHDAVPVVFRQDRHERADVRGIDRR